MIPLPLIIKAVPWRLVGYGLAIGLIGLWFWRVSVWHKAYERLERVEARLELEQSCGKGSACEARQAALEAAQAETTTKVVATYESELAAVRNRPARVVRVCSDPGNVQGARPTGASDGTGPAAGVVSGPAGRDLGPDLYQLAREADEVAARLRALQEWNRALSK